AIQRHRPARVVRVYSGESRRLSAGKVRPAWPLRSDRFVVALELRPAEARVTFLWGIFKMFVPCRPNGRPSVRAPGDRQSPARAENGGDCPSFLAQLVSGFAKIEYFN